MNANNGRLQSSPANNDALRRVDSSQTQETHPADSTSANHGSGPGAATQAPTNAPSAPQNTEVPGPQRQSWETIDEVVQILKTAFPLLILSMETMVDQIHQRFKATAEEEIYRLVCMLLLDAMQVSCFQPYSEATELTNNANSNTRCESMFSTTTVN